jgi:multiple sugar transport system ATP-binding protein
MASLKLEHIYKVYPNGTKAVNDISLDIQDGEFIVFVGPSGCGKSTTLRMIAGLEDITAGELYIDNQIVNDVEPKDRDIAMVFQNYALYPHMTVYENMAFGLKLRHVPDDEIQEKVLWAADILGIKDYLDRRPKNMSGGQRQRVALGRSILRNPKVMLLDEPLSNLDAKLRTQMRTEIAKLHQKLKTTFIYVTHDQIEAMTLGDRVVVMKLGRIQQVDTPKNLYDYPSNKFVAGFIGTPQMNFFHANLLREGENVKVTLTADNAVLNVPYNELIKVLPAFLDGKHPVTMGIRCEHVFIADEKDPNAVKIKVSHFEELGAECLIYGNVNLNDDGISAEKEGNIIVKVKEVNGIRPGDVISVRFDMDHAYFFDDKTEETIVPRIPSYNSLIASIHGNRLEVLGASLALPKALSRPDCENAELQVPTDSLILGKAGIRAKVLKTEMIGKVKLLHLFADGRVFFAQTDKDYAENSEIDVGFDFTRLTLVKDGKEIFAPLAALDSFLATFYNYRTVVAKDPDPSFIAFRDDKIKSATQFMDAQILLTKQEYEKKKLEIQNTDNSAVKEKARQDQESLCAKNSAEIAKIKETTKASLKKMQKDFAGKKAKITQDNNKLFADKKAKEVAEYKAFKANNKDKDALKRRSDEYHIFMDNFETDKQNTLNLAINGITMEYESQVSAVKANAHRQTDLLRKEMKDGKEKTERAENPTKFLDKEYSAKFKALEDEKEEAVTRAGLVFFFEFAGGYYSMATDIISNKLIQGLGTRVFSKEFRIELPHDGYVFSEKKNAFHAKAEEVLDYGDDVYFIRLSYQDANGVSRQLFLKNSQPIEVGKDVALDFAIDRSEITETGMNIRLY